jgi:hypothetical protein
LTSASLSSIPGSLSTLPLRISADEDGVRDTAWRAATIRGRREFF